MLLLACCYPMVFKHPDKVIDGNEVGIASDVKALERDTRGSGVGAAWCAGVVALRLYLEQSQERHSPTQH